MLSTLHASQTSRALTAGAPPGMVDARARVVGPSCVPFRRQHPIRCDTPGRGGRTDDTISVQYLQTEK